ncbi:hypothetical protein MAR_011767 [Mya arenaria]|uniref:Uncharacterized protein n=1 Tax=Mya arenaria TaxID=6604 RepID=A0ABY7FYT0_MYAAR|nr:hypothetical protein MAR_011767 [Mya arenaria]
MGYYSYDNRNVALGNIISNTISRSCKAATLVAFTTEGNLSQSPVHLHKAVHGRLAFTHLHRPRQPLSLSHPHFRSSIHDFAAGKSVNHTGCHVELGSSSFVQPCEAGEGSVGDGLRDCPQQKPAWLSNRWSELSV